MAATVASRTEKKPVCLFDLPPNFFDSCRLLRSHPSATLHTIPSPSPISTSDQINSSSNRSESLGEAEGLSTKRKDGKGKEPLSSQWTCNTCRAEFESLQDQRSHFKSDLHRLNVKLSIAGKKSVKEEDLEALENENVSLFQELEISSISGSEDESEEEESISDQRLFRKSKESLKQKLYFRLDSGDTVSISRCLLLDESEEISHSPDDNKMNSTEISSSILEEQEVINRLNCLIHETRDKMNLRIVLLISGGHFAGCVFDGKSIIAHKTFHRYVVRAKAGKKQSAKDATGKAAHSAGSSLRRHNEAALKKEVMELIISWKPYFDSCKCVFIHAPSKNRQLFFDGERIQSILQACTIRNIPLTVHRPTFKEGKRVYNHLLQLNYEIEEEIFTPLMDNKDIIKDVTKEKQEEELEEIKETICSGSSSGEEHLSDTDRVTNETTPLHEAAKSGDAKRALELLEEGLNPCLKDERGRTPYMVASEKEVRNTFRRFMALNLDKWDWHTANVPSALTKEMEESQAEKQAEKDAKRKARAKELKKLKKVKEKAKAQASQSQGSQPDVSHGQVLAPVSTVKPNPLQSFEATAISKEEERQRRLAEEREKRAAAAERRMAALKAQTASTTAPLSSSSSTNNGANSGEICSCCHSSLAGKVPFHRYHYKYCSSTCMHLHREILEDG